MRQRTRFVVLVVVAMAMVVAACGGGDQAGSAARDIDPDSAVTDPGPVHVHGLGINPKDGALFIATHTGLFRAGPDERRSVRVADRYQDTMGFSVAGPDRFLGSGHPDLRDEQPPFLGLIESRDAGRTWKPISLLGRRDFHVLEGQGRRVYGFGSDFETRQEALLVSEDAGRTWRQRSAPEPLLSLAIDPRDPDRVVASGARRLYVSDDGGRRWRPTPGPAGLVVWSTTPGLFAIDPDGKVLATAGPGEPWREVGDIDGQPAAFEGAGRGDLYVALHDGTIKRSTDGGSSWTVRARP